MRNNNRETEQMMNIIPKIQILFGISITIFLIFLVACKVNNLGYENTSLKSRVQKKCISYKNNWEIERFDIDDEDKEISILFSRKEGTSFNVQEIPMIVNEIKDYVFSQEEPYNELEYRLIITMQPVKPCTISIDNITYDMYEIGLVSYDTYDYYEVTIKDLAEWYPDATVLRTDKTDLESIKLFHNLRAIYLSNGITNKQKEDILSIFPKLDFGDTPIIDD